MLVPERFLPTLQRLLRGLIGQVSRLDGIDFLFYLLNVIGDVLTRLRLGRILVCRFLFDADCFALDLHLVDGRIQSANC